MFFRGKEGEKPTQNHQMEGISDLFYPILLLEGALPIHYPKGAAQSPNATKNTTKINGFGLAVIL